ncbi:unnamed protein product, partial [Linum tenue]
GSCASNFEGGTSDFPTLWQRNRKQCEFCTAAFALFRRTTVNLDPILRSEIHGSSRTPPTSTLIFSKMLMKRTLTRFFIVFNLLASHSMALVMGLPHLLNLVKGHQHRKLKKLNIFPVAK